MHGAQKRVLGAEHLSDTLTSANSLAAALSRQGKSAEAEVIQREVHGVRKRVLGAEHPRTLTSANSLADSLSGQGKYVEAERIQREVSTWSAKARARGRASGHADECEQSGCVPLRPRQICRG